MLYFEREIQMTDWFFFGSLILTRRLWREMCYTSEAGRGLCWQEDCEEKLALLHTLRKLYFRFLSHWMGFDPDDSFPFDFEPNEIPFGSKLKAKLSPG